MFILRYTTAVASKKGAIWLGGPKEQDEFDRFYSAAIDGVLQHILPHLDAEKADRLIDLIIEDWA